MAIGLPMAMVGGTLYAVAANGVSYFAERAKKTGVELSSKQNLALEFGAFCLYMIGGLIATTAYAMGDPVPLLQGALVATNLMLNMIFQIALGISLYTKAMRIGTVMTFVVVMFQLSVLGPDPRGDDVDITPYFKRVPAIVWFIVEGALLIGTGIGMLGTKTLPSESFAKIFMWALHLAVWGSVTDNVASTFGVFKGALLYILMGLYGLVSVYILGLASKAPAVCDANTFVPLNLSLQLVFNAATGVIVWEDLERMGDRSPQAYFTTFAVIILGVYVASPSADVVESLLRWRIFKTTTLSSEQASSPFGKAVLNLVHKWQSVKIAPSKESEESAKDALKHALSVGAERGRISPEELVSLSVELYNGDTGSFAFSAAIMKWLDRLPYMNEYFRHDPEFREKLLQLLPESERCKLPPSFVNVGSLNSGADPRESELSMRASFVENSH
mmetsp:Transcript_103461/g.163281  ORF Transcript_103461/g.163281 Transcript_103461/m.163281 type:complete len:445 (-) Transcript_103461:58-1392(-)